MKLIVINASDTRRALRNAVRELRGHCPAVMENAVINIAYQRLVRNPLARNPVTDAARDDPAWVFDRLAEGRTVYRIGGPSYMYRREVHLAHVHVCRIMQTLHDELDAQIDGRGNAGRLAKMTRLAKRLRSMSVDDFDAALVRWGARRRDPDHAEPVSLEELRQGEDLPREVITIGAYRLRRCVALSQIVTLGRTLRNCLERAGDSAHAAEHYGIWQQIFAIESDNAVIGAASFNVDGELIEALGPRNADLPDDVQFAVNGLADILKKRRPCVIFEELEVVG